MRIQRLELFGFKSFPDRTTFEFGSGISAVVGPNGSGKSNVVDALRWVIGEQSARSLRGKDMADVIFAGSSARSPVGFAEVALTLSSAEGEPFPGDLSRFEEVEVGRRLYRDGTSEYLLNRVKCRRRDIVDLFMDTGVGSNLYSFIAQGQVDRIVSQSPLERRSLIDEAAGISRYKVRRDEALTRLTATGAQLDRARDVSDEMGRRLRTLEKQVLAAGRFRRLRAAVRQREIALGVVKYAALSEDRRALRDRLRRDKQEAEALGRSVTRLEEEAAVRQAEVDSVAEAVSTWRDEAAELEAQRREAEGARTLHLSRQREQREAANRASELATAAREEAAAAETVAAARGVELENLVDVQVPTVDAEEEALTVTTARLSKLSEEATRVNSERSHLQELIGELEGAQEPQAPTPTEVDSSLRALDVERTRLRAVEEEVTATLSSVQEAQRAHRQQAERSRELQRQAHASWRRQQSHREALRDRVTAAVVKDVRARTVEWQRQVDRRAQAWLQALERRQRITEETLRASAETRRAPPSRAAVTACETEFSAARETLRQSSDQNAAAAGSLAALESEMAALERQRLDGQPEAWAERSVLDDVISAEDPLRLARPDLLALPVLTAADLDVPNGRGILDLPRCWRVSDEVAASTVRADGHLRIDADGVVEIGVREDRWATARVELEQARAQAAAMEEAWNSARQRAAVSQSALEEAERSWKHEARRVREEADVWLAESLQTSQAAVRATLDVARGEWRGLVAPAVEVPWGLLARACQRVTEPTWIEPEAGPDSRQAELAVVEARKAVEAVTRSVEAERERLRALNEAAAHEQARFDAALRQFQVDQVRLASLTTRRDALVEVEGLEAGRAAVERARERLSSAQARRDAAQGEASDLAAKRARIAAEQLAADQAGARASLAAETHDTEQTRAAGSSEEAGQAMAVVELKAKELAVQRAEVLEKLHRDRARLDELKTRVDAVRSQITTQRGQLTKAETSTVTLTQRVEALQLEIEGLRKRLGDRYQVSLPGLLDRLHVRRTLSLDGVEDALTVGEVTLDPVESLTLTTSRLDDEDWVVRTVEDLEKLRVGLARIGDVNLAAEEEYAELHARFVELDAQRADLEASVISIRAAIAKMNKTCRERFRDAYDRVNESFQLSYPKLVGGGDARLALTDDEDLLKTGVDIFVRPPGKRLQNLTLLSGGEKAMTAIALLLALFEVRPSPFCVLDEVDAPLDEANGARFNEMVRAMSAQSQFIVITHNRKTMECADVLYGVTMADPGVSKLVSVALGG